MVTQPVRRRRVDGRFTIGAEQCNGIAFNKATIALAPWRVGNIQPKKRHGANVAADLSFEVGFDSRYVRPRHAEQPCRSAGPAATAPRGRQRDLVAPGQCSARQQAENRAPMLVAARAGATSMLRQSPPKCAARMLLQRMSSDPGDAIAGSAIGGRIVDVEEKVHSPLRPVHPAVAGVQRLLCAYLGFEAVEKRVEVRTVGRAVSHSFGQSAKIAVAPVSNLASEQARSSPGPARRVQDARGIFGQPERQPFPRRRGRDRARRGPSMPRRGVAQRPWRSTSIHRVRCGLVDRRAHTSPKGCAKAGPTVPHRPLPSETRPICIGPGRALRWDISS